ncbi:replication-relaxation family protein [Actinospica robiniae]|uniref:replication-relaxation family protein n=1 Tax=Actinospica robiniae TaxID=304901 RepID=UPI00040884A1|nr:replication-relaxation family protein [Actinospica robiniae]
MNTTPIPPTSAPTTPVYLPAPPEPEAGARARRTHLAILSAHLTVRDKWIIAMVHEHKVLTSRQIARLAFGNERVARRRLATLTHELRALDRFRPLLQIGAGTSPEHYVLGPGGATYLVAALDVNPRQFGYSRSRAHQIAVSAQLAHTVGCNDVFVRIAAAHRTNPAGGRLAAWWSERRCLRLWQDLARPDGYGHYTLAAPGTEPAQARNLRFFLEYDTGTEALTRLPAKLPGYARLAAASSPTPVLFYLPTAQREENLHQLLRADPPRIPVATTSPEALNAAETGPTGPVWRPYTGRARIPGRPVKRHLLIDLDQLLPERAPRTTTGPAAAPGWWTEPPAPIAPAISHSRR